MPTSERSIDAVLLDLAAGTPDAPVRLGRYDVVGSLGRGGMGTVYDAVDRERGTRVALKTVSEADATASVWLKREFRGVADVVHPNLAPVYELASDRGVWFFTMELVAGVTLSRWARAEREGEPERSSLPISRTIASPVNRTVRSAGVESPSSRVVRATEERRRKDEPSPFELPTRKLTAAAGEIEGAPKPASVATAPTRGWPELRAALADLVSGVAALHAAGLRHGDIKPANVLVRTDGRVVVVDFGLVRPVVEHDDARMPRGGTPTFMAPEQFGDAPVGPEADWYAVGATLYRVLTGWAPFEAASLLDLYLKKMHQPPAAPHALVPAIPRDLSDVCMALMRADPAKRPGREALFGVFAADARASVSSSPSDGASLRPARSARLRFVGRDSELCALERAYGEARAGRLTVVHAHGPSGIGKSSLLTSFLGAVRDVDSALVLRGRCYERESVPYKGFDRIVDELSDRLQRMSRTELEKLLPEWAGELGRAFPALGSVNVIAERAAGKHVAHDPIELRRRAWSALGALLGALRTKTPIVVAIDDLQWADDDSAHLLAALLRGASPPALLVVILYRPAEAAANAALRGWFELGEKLRAEGQLVDLPLAALGDDEALDLAREALRDAGAPESESRAKLLATEARGVPFFIEELAHFFGAPGRDADHGVSLERAILARVRALPQDQRALVEVAAVAASPLPQSIVFEAAAVPQSALAPLLALRSASLVSWVGAGADDSVAVYHDRIREAVVGALPEEARLALHLAVGRAIGRAIDERPEAARSLAFDAVRHLGAASRLIDDPASRIAVARLHADAGDRARRAAAFHLAFDCFEGGIALLPDDGWTADYALALRLHAGATECAYLSASWEAMDRRIADLKEHARTIMDELVAWEAQIDACVGRHKYAAAVDLALEVLALLGVALPRDPTMDEVGAAVKHTLGRLTEIGPQGLISRPDLSDPVALAANRILVRASPATYFSKPLLLPLIACNLVTTSIDRGVSPATPYALAVFGIVLNTLELYAVSHEWGELAHRLLERWPDRRLEAATRHILQNLVCCWRVPLFETLEPLRKNFDIGCATGDYEYASYSAHGYSNQALYAGRPLAPLVDEALELGRQMRALGQVNAVHVHAPFEQLLKALTGRLADPSALDDEDFSEQKELASSAAEGSRSGTCILSIAAGIARYTFGRFDEALAHFERAHAYVDAIPSCWHLPIAHQFGALAACAVFERTEDPALLATARASLAALERLAVVAPVNFAHRVELVRGELARVEGHREVALTCFDEAIRLGHQAAWVNDIALANELASRVEPDEAAAKRRLRTARAGYVAWGATAKVDELSAKLTAGS